MAIVGGPNVGSHLCLLAGGPRLIVVHARRHPRSSQSGINIGERFGIVDTGGIGIEMSTTSRATWRRQIDSPSQGGRHSFRGRYTQRLVSA